MSAEQTAPPPQSYQLGWRPPVFHEVMPRPLSWQEWLDQRAQPVDVPCGHDNEGD